MVRYRITVSRPDQPEAPEQTWVLLPDEPSAVMQAEEHCQREKVLHVRVYREATGEERCLVKDLPPKRRAG